MVFPVVKSFGLDLSYKKLMAVLYQRAGCFVRSETAVFQTWNFFFFLSSRVFFYLKSPGKIKPIAKQGTSFCAEAMSLVNPKWPCRTVLSQQLCAVRTASQVSAGYSFEGVGALLSIGKSSLFEIQYLLPAQPICHCGGGFAATSSECGNSSCLLADRCRVYASCLN